jgi:hypothetical protein
LTRNIMQIPVQEIGRTQVLLTLLGGNPVHGSYAALA